jgi:4-hydroxybenzoate polyprenyltransferase
LKKASAYLRMARPAGMVTSMADVTAGVAIAGRFESGLDKNFINILLLCAGTAFLYAGGAIYYDVFNAKQDAIDHPDRSIPSGALSPRLVKPIGFILLLTGIALAGVGSNLGGFIALAIAFFILIYAKLAKSSPIFSPFFLGICRGLNLILGISLVAFEMQAWWFLGLIPIVYTYAVALIGYAKKSKHTKQDLQIGAILYATALGAILYQANTNGELETTGIVLIAFALFILVPLSNAIRYPSTGYIEKAAKAGTRYFILMDVAWSITFDSWLAAAIIGVLLVVFLWLLKILPSA